MKKQGWLTSRLEGGPAAHGCIRTRTRSRRRAKDVAAALSWSIGSRCRRSRLAGFALRVARASERAERYWRKRDLRIKRSTLPCQITRATDTARMTMTDLLAPAGALASALLGALGLCAPLRAARMVGLSPLGARGVSELRATYGGLFLGLGLAALLWQQPAAYGVAGAAWLGAALARLASIVLDRSVSALNIGGVALEAVIGALLLAGVW